MNKPVTVCLCAVLLLAACKEFIETSVSGRKVVLLAPANGTESNIYNQTFWWEPVEDALSYRLQIVTPSFDSLSRLVADTLIKGNNKFNISLEPGRYQWRLRAENGSSRSAYSTSSFIIHLSSIKEQQVQLRSPGNNAVSSQASVTYKWDKIFGAARYRLQVDTNNFADENKLLFNGTTPNIEYTLSFAAEKPHQWRVRAEADTIQSKWSVINKVTYDITPPGKAVLSSPASNLVLAKPVSLQWIGVATAKNYELVALKSDSATVYSTSFPAMVNGTSFSFTEGINGEKIYWKVRAVDEAGNKGTYSDMRNFTVQ